MKSMGSFNVQGYFDTKTDTDRMQLELNQMEMKASPLSVQFVDDGIVLPHKPGSGWGLGGVVDKRGAIVAESIYDNGWARFGGSYAFDEAAVDYVDEDIVWFGFFFRHWGHFLMDFVGRAWFMSSDNYCHQKVAYVSDSSTIDGNYARFIELLGVKPVDIIKIDRPTRFRRVIIPELSYIEGRFYAQEYKRMFDTIVASHVPSDKFSRLRNVYLSRADFSKGLFSKDIGQDAIDELFRMNEWAIVSPERLTLDEQITIWNTADEIACLNGTIPLNVAFSRKPQARLLALNKTALLHYNLLRYQKIFEREVVYVDVYDSALTRFSRSVGAGPFRCTISRSLKAMCTDYGLAVPKESSLRNVGDVTRFFAVWIKDGIIPPLRKRLSPIKRRLSSSWRAR